MGVQKYWVGPANGRSSGVNWSLLSGGPADQSLAADDDARFDSLGVNPCNWDTPHIHDIRATSTYNSTITLTVNLQASGFTVLSGTTFDQSSNSINTTGVVEFRGALVASSSAARFYASGSSCVLNAEALDVPFGYEFHLLAPCTHESNNSDPTFPLVVIDCGVGNTITLTDVGGNPGIGPIKNISGDWGSLESSITVGGRGAQSWIGTAPEVYKIIEMVGGDGGADITHKFYGHTNHTMEVISDGNPSPRLELYFNNIGGNPGVFTNVDKFGEGGNQTWKLQDPGVWDCGADMSTGIISYGSASGEYAVRVNGYSWFSDSWFVPPESGHLTWDLGGDGHLTVENRFMENLGLDVTWLGSGSIAYTTVSQNVNMTNSYIPYTMTIKGSMSTDKVFGAFNVRNLIIDGSSFTGKLSLDPAQIYNADYLKCSDFTIDTITPGVQASVSVGPYSYQKWFNMAIQDIDIPNGIIFATTDDGNVDNGNNTIPPLYGIEFSASAPYPPPCTASNGLSTQASSYLTETVSKPAATLCHSDWSIFLTVEEHISVGVFGYSRDDYGHMYPDSFRGVQVNTFACRVSDALCIGAMGTGYQQIPGVDSIVCIFQGFPEGPVTFEWVEYNLQYRTINQELADWMATMSGRTIGLDPRTV